MTRYPKGGSGRRWTVAELRAIKATWTGDTLADGDGLTGDVRVAKDGTVAVRWRYSFRWGERTTWFQVGTWPTASLEEIRRCRDGARLLVSQGINPNTKRDAERIESQRKLEATVAEATAERERELSFRNLFTEWLTSGVRRADGNAELKRSFERDVLPAVGDVLMRELTEPALRRAIEPAVSRGANRLAVILCADIKQMFAWAERRQPWRRLLADGNPADLLDIATIVSDDYDLDTVRNRVLAPEEIKDLRNRLARLRVDYESAPQGKRLHLPRPVRKTTEIAIWVCLATLSRIGETLKAEWSHVDLDAGTWFIPKKNVKGIRGKKQDQLVFLSPFALGRFRELHAVTGTGRWCFPSADGETHIDLKTVTKQVGDRQATLRNRKHAKGRRQDGSLVLANGVNGYWTPHDLRRTGATMMQSLGVPLDTIDRCQNHILRGSRVRRAYLHHDYAEETRKAWLELGRMLEKLLLDPPPDAREVNVATPVRPSQRTQRVRGTRSSRGQVRNPE